MGTDLDRQVALELQGFQQGITRFNNTRTKTLKDKNRDNLSLKPEANLVKRYIGELDKRIRLGLSGRGTSKFYAARDAIRKLPAYRAAYLTLRFIFNLPSSRNASLQRAFVILGSHVETDLNYFNFTEAAPGYVSKVEENLTTTHLKHRLTVLNHSRRKVKLTDENDKVVQVGIPDLNWDDEMRMSVGRLLLDITQKTTDLLTIDTFFRPNTNKKVKTIDVSAKYQSLLEEHTQAIAESSPIHYPMIMEPKDWDGSRGGGFYSTYKSLQLKLVRTRMGHRHDVIDQEKPERVFDAINKIQKTPFKINTWLLDVFDYAVEHARAGISPFEREASVPPKFWDTDEELKVIINTDPDRFTAWKAERSKAYDAWHRDTSNRINAKMQVHIARQFSEEPKLYFVWTLDWRGRIYPVQEYINPQANDSGRGLLLFAKGKRLGETGSYWLAVHLANTWAGADDVTGKATDKLQNDARNEWTMRNSDWIEACARDPYSNRQWEDADKPWQFLAAAREWLGFIEQGYDFITHLPVQMDGSNSGLQHYSGLLKDEVGGKSVNLVPGDEPADVYAEGVSIAQSIMQEDLQRGGDNAQYAREWLNLGLTRGHGKRPIMTVCYGATQRGFADQTYAYLRKKKQDGHFADPFKACLYFAKVISQAISSLLVKAREGMDFLQEIAKFLSGNGLEIRWTTPVGFPVIQDYLKTKTKRVDTVFGGTRVQLNLQVDTTKKNSRRNGNAIAPNYVHSLDSAHLMLTALEMYDRGLHDYSFIHDSFGCHACDVPVMAEVLRDTFVKMYSDNLLLRFVDEVREQLPAHLRPEFNEIVDINIPGVGSLDLDVVRRSAYFFA